MSGNAIATSARGVHVLNDPSLNKGTAFTLDERRSLGLDGLLPTAVETLERQLRRTAEEYAKFHTDMERHIYLRQLQDHNDVLFHAFLVSNLTDVMPIVYTPTVGAACEQFSHIYRRPHGLFVSYRDRQRMSEQFDSFARNVDVIVVTDGERILGLGDQGIGGMGIPIGKLSLYSAVGGITPARTLPVILDVGTNNRERLNDPLYVGWRHERIDDEEYYDFVDQFVENVKRRFPHALLQWEDFAQRHAAPILLRYRDELLSFNDDIQGTAAVTLAALRSAFRSLGSRLSDHRFCIVGAGSAGTGIAQMIRDVIAAESGVDDPVSLIFMTDRKGLIHDGRDDLTASKRAFAQPDSVIATWGVRGTPSLEDVVANARPTVLVGVSGQPGLFSESVVRQMLEWTSRPIVMPMSNPTSSSEGVPSDILRWTGGRALVATGSPFDDVDVGGSPIRISQSNNVYVFPGVGLGVILAKARKVTDAMLVAAAASLAEDAPGKPEEGLLPPIESVAQTSRHVALAVAKAARDEGVADEFTDEESQRRLEAHYWTPVYPEVRAV